MKKFLALGIVFVSVSYQALAQSIAPVVEQYPHWLQLIIDGIPNGDSKMVAIAAFIIGGVIDLSLRIWKTSKPLDLMLIISNLLRGLSKACLKASDLIDHVLPQRSNEPKDPV